MKVDIVSVKSLVTRSKLPASDYVINPYVGCPHGCQYCYARFMKRFANHSEEWGDFIDVKNPERPINPKILCNKTVFLSSVTDCYNPFEEEYRITRRVLNELLTANCELNISTKSSLILRDIDLLRQFKRLKVAMSINTLDEKFRSDMDNASSISDRLAALSTLHNEGIHTVLFMSPIFPGLTDYQSIIEVSKGFVDEYWFEDLNLRGDYKQTILDYIFKYHQDIYHVYDLIYNCGCSQYWEQMSKDISQYCIASNIRHTIFFNHKGLVDSKKH